MALQFSQGLLSSLGSYGQGAGVPADPSKRNLMEQYGVTNPLLQAFGQSLGQATQNLEAGKGRVVFDAPSVQKEADEDNMRSIVAKAIATQDPTTIDAVAKGLADRSPDYSMKLTEYAQKLLQQRRPDWKTMEVDGTVLKYDAKDPTKFDVVYKGDKLKDWDLKTVGGNLIAVDPTTLKTKTLYTSPSEEKDRYKFTTVNGKLLRVDLQNPTSDPTVLFSDAEDDPTYQFRDRPDGAVWAINPKNPTDRTLVFEGTSAQFWTQPQQREQALNAFASVDPTLVPLVENNLITEKNWKEFYINAKENKEKGITGIAIPNRLLAKAEMVAGMGDSYYTELLSNTEGRLPVAQLNSINSAIDAQLDKDVPTLKKLNITPENITASNLAEITNKVLVEGDTDLANVLLRMAERNEAMKFKIKPEEPFNAARTIDPDFDTSLSMADFARQVEVLGSMTDKAGSTALMERQLTALFKNDVKAVQELERFRNSKSLGRRVGDTINMWINGEYTQSTYEDFLAVSAEMQNYYRDRVNTTISSVERLPDVGSKYAGYLRAVYGDNFFNTGRPNNAGKYQGWEVK